MLLDLIADSFGDRAALTDGQGSLTYGELRQLARTAASELADRGAATLAFADVSSRAVPTALFGAAWAGASYAPLNFRLPAEALRPQIDRLDRPRTVASTELCLPVGRPGRGLDAGVVAGRRPRRRGVQWNRLLPGRARAAPR